MKDIFADRLRICRENASLTQTEAAARVGLKKNTYQSYELGTRAPRVVILTEIAQFYDVSTDYLLGRVDDPRPYPRSTQ